MINELKAKSCSEHSVFGWSVLTRGLLGLIAVALIAVNSCPANSQQSRVLQRNSNALITEVTVLAGEAYSLKSDQEGDVWIAISPLLLTTSKKSGTIRREISAGDAAIVGPNEELEFWAERNSHPRLIVVKPTGAHQTLTVGPFILDRSIEDASERNTTLLVAISSCRFTDIRNLGNESQWIPSKPSIVTMEPGSARWVRPGIHHFKNLGSSAARLVSIEW